MFSLGNKLILFNCINITIFYFYVYVNKFFLIFIVY